MIGWFQNRKRKKQIAILEKKLVEKLSSDYPAILEIYNHATSFSPVIILTPTPFIQLQHSIEPLYYEKNRRKHNNHYILKGIEIKKKKSTEFVGITIQMVWDLISTIYIDHPNDFWKYYDSNSFRINNLIRSDIQTRNEDAEKLKGILKNVQTDQIIKLEIEDTFEIEIDEKKFYTIVDMEDGNYIAVNSKGKVYILNHDSTESVKLIHNSIHDFLNKFSGNKKELVKYFDD